MYMYVPLIKSTVLIYIESTDNKPDFYIVLYTSHCWHFLFKLRQCVGGTQTAEHRHKVSRYSGWMDGLRGVTWSIGWNRGVPRGISGARVDKQVYRALTYIKSHSYKLGNYHSQNWSMSTYTAMTVMDWNVTPLFNIVILFLNLAWHNQTPFHFDIWKWEGKSKVNQIFITLSKGPKKEEKNSF